MITFARVAGYVRIITSTNFESSEKERVWIERAQGALARPGAARSIYKKKWRIFRYWIMSL